MFRKFWLDVILATMFIFGMMGALNSFTAFKIFDVFDPIGEAFSDMEVTDIVFSQLRDEPVADDRIILVNMGTLPRPDIGIMLQIISQYNPKVIGMDSFFYFPKDSIGDSVLEEGFASVENLVMASKLLHNPETDRFDSIAYSWPQFAMYGDPGFANLVTDAEVQEDLKMCREFVPQQVALGENQHSFAVKLASYYDPEAAARFLERGNEVETINYRGNVLDYGATKFGTKFFALDVQDVFEENFTRDLIEDKIVIFCYLGDYLGDRRAIEDKYFTPLNEKYIGRAYPDMFGGVIHANIVSMILNEDYIDAMNDYSEIILAIVLCFLNVALFSLIYRRIPRWYDGITKLFQIIEMGFLVYIMIVVLDQNSFKIELGLALFAVGISGDSLEVYYGVVKNIFTREGRRSLFKIDKL
ncbi:MAG: CHASE2 domain-containing protein [Cyclobacteriaceae bacterium]|nr:CHASE2 domain-containing protein [Cyclobacteriaceae bacterium SS2]